MSMDQHLCAEYRGKEGGSFGETFTEHLLCTKCLTYPEASGICSAGALFSFCSQMFTERCWAPEALPKCSLLAGIYGVPTVCHVLCVGLDGHGQTSLATKSHARCSIFSPA